MPALLSSHFLSTAVDQTIHGASNNVFSRNITNETGQGLEVICAWPVSGQYGPGSRILYYVLIAACVLARKAEWIKNACLAAALLLPAVASLHAIALAALHRDGAVDLDIYGAFQLCAIGILAAPVTVRLSRTYFYDPGRNAIFLWAGLILVGTLGKPFYTMRLRRLCRTKRLTGFLAIGLLSLTVEFYRVQTVLCTADGHGSPLSPDPNDFPYDAQPACNMICTSDTGPQSPMRGGAANNKYVIPAPNKFTFGTGTLLCVACCVHAILWLASMTDKILEINWKSRFGITDDMRNEAIEGTNGATVGKMYQVNESVRFFMSVAIIPIFTGAVLAVLIMGEINFFSDQMRYQNEPMASIGQWSPIVGTGLAVAGSLYLLLAADIEAAMRGPTSSAKERTCRCEDCHEHQSSGRRHYSRASRSRVRQSKDGEIAENNSRQGIHANAILHSASNSSYSLTRDLGYLEETRHFSRDSESKTRQRDTRLPATSITGSHAEHGSRHIVAATLVALGGALGSATHKSFDLSNFRDGAALDFPEIPGERERNINLPHIRESYSKRLEEDGTPAVLVSRSRASSFNGYGASGHALDSLRPSRDPSPQPGRILSRPASPASSPSHPRASTLPVGSGSQLPRSSSYSQEIEQNRGRPRQRHDTLEVPVAAHLRTQRDLSPSVSEPTPDIS